MKSILRALWILALGLLSICILGGVVIAIRNRNLSTEPESVERLAPLDKQRLAEAAQLKQELGNNVWPGWGESLTPHLLWNRETSFLVGYPTQPSGWELVPGDEFNGEAYYRQDTDDPTNFAVLIDGVWVASMATKGETDAFIIEMFQDILPPVIESAFPYRFLIQPSEVQISGMLHEDFHVFQMQEASEKFESAEQVYADDERYWQVDEEMRAAWKEEIGYLIDALRTDSKSEKQQYVIQFLETREQRRREARLSSELIAYERELEWLEGLAKYVEVSIWQEASRASSYQPVLSPELDGDFQEYETFNRHWRLEINQLNQQASQQGDTRFYYTGLAQGALLDDLYPGWKNRILEEGIFLDDLLRAAVLASSESTIDDK